MNISKLRNTMLAGAALMLSSIAPLQAATTADVLFVVDESGSMSTEHNWIGSMVTALDSALGLAGVTNNQYGLVGFGSSSHVSGPQVGHTHTVGTGDFGTAAELSTATSGLLASGGIEDGYEAINFAFNNYSFRNGAAVNVILITDEDRDNVNGNSLTYNSILSLLQGKNALLNAVVNASFGTAAAGGALGVAGLTPTDAYFANGSGGYNIASPGFATGGYGTTVADYVDLALATGGAAWDLNKLRAGGLVADSFTQAFVDIKVAEIIIQPPSEVPVPAAAFMFAPALLGFLGLRRKAKNNVA